MQIDHYTLGKQLSANPKSQVYEAMTADNTQKVVIKLFDVSGDAARRQKLVEQGLQLKRLRHPNIVSVIDLGSTADTVYWVSEYVDGVTLNEIVPRDQGLSLQAVWPILTQISSGLTAAHAMGIVHFDLKPGNILVANETAQIVDFGVEYTPARGTAGYVAPEVVTAHVKPDHRADVYAMGTLLAFLLTGRRPFSGNTPEQIVASQLKSNLHISGYLAQSSELQAIIQKATQIDPYDRYLNVADFMESVSAYHRHLLLQPDPIQISESEPVENLTETRIGHFVLGTIFAGIALITMIIYYALIESF